MYFFLSWVLKSNRSFCILDKVNFFCCWTDKKTLVKEEENRNYKVHIWKYMSVSALNLDR